MPLLAALPLLVVLYLMIGRRWGASQAGPAGWLTAIVVGALTFGAGGAVLAVALGRALLLALFVLYIIWMALLLYHVLNEAGVIEVVGQELPGLADDAPGQALLLAWVLGSFLQGASGFGVPAAVVAPLLVGLGIGANTAVVIALLGHAWAVSFGSLGSSFLALMAATGLPGEQLAGPTALLLGFCCLACGVGVLWLVGGVPALRARGGLMLLLAVVMGGTQWALATAGLWTMAAFGAGLLGMVVMVPILYYSRRREGAVALDGRRLAAAMAPYALLVLVIVLGELVFAGALSRVEINATFPVVETARGWITAGGPGRSVNVFGHAGALLLYTALLAFGWYRWRGAWGGRVYDGRRIVRLTVRDSAKSTIAIVTLLAMAVTMQQAGMTQQLADLLSETGVLFPLLSPFLGALGAVMTGSNTNSNVVFGQLQQQTAVALQLSVPYILAAQTAGGAIGSLFAPAKVVVGCSTVAGADDGIVLKRATAVGGAIIAGVGLIVLIVLS